jgi:hypothetical protein
MTTTNDIEAARHDFEPDIAGLEPHRCKRLDCGLRSNHSVHYESDLPRTAKKEEEAVLERDL